MSDTVARLIELEAGRPVRAHELRPGTLRIGRDPSAEIRLQHHDVSRFHAELHLGEHGARLRDLGSKNGVALDGTRIREATLDPTTESRIHLGKLELRLEFPYARIDRILARSGEMTVRRPRVSPPTSEAPPAAPRSLLLPILATLVFAALLAALMVHG